MRGGAIGGLVVCIALVFKKEWAYFLAPIYALLEGLFVGGISAMYGAIFNGIVVQAVLLTIGTLAGLLAAYRPGWIKAPKFMEWYAAFGLMVTLIWLYIEFLRLLSKLMSRD